MLTEKDVFEKIREAALAATGSDERALQIDYDALEKKVASALAKRTIALLHINRYLPEGYEDQGHFNVLAVCTGGNVVFDMVIGDQYFRCDIFSARDLNKIQTIDGIYKDEEKREEISFFSLRLQHGDEAHILLALNEEERGSALDFWEIISLARHPAI